MVRFSALYANFSDVLETPGTDIASNVAAGILKKFVKDRAPHYHCLVCEIDVSGDIPATHHLKGRGHEKMLLR